MERTEKIGLGIATAGHVLLFGLLSTTFLRPPSPLRLNNPPLEVSLVDELALRSAAPRISTQPPPPTRAPVTGPEQEAAPSPPPPVPSPGAEHVVAPPPEPAPRRPAAPSRPAVTPRPPPQPAMKREAVPPPQPSTTRTTRSQTPAKPVRPATESAKGNDRSSRGGLLSEDFLKGLRSSTPAPARPAAAPAATQIGAAQKAALDAEIRRQLRPFWRSPTGADVEQLRTTVAVDLAQDGSIVGAPDVVDTTGITPSNQGQVRLHREQAIKAVRLASPFKLPPDLYSGWKSLIISFDKRLSQ